MSRIFNNDAWEELSLAGNIIQYGYYHRYRNPDGTINPEFKADQISSLILDVKDKKEKGINFFFQQLNPVIADNISICVVPGHDASSKNKSGIAILGRRLASENRIDKIDFLLRNKSIDKLSHGGNRQEEIHKESIVSNPNLTITDDVVLLVDDVTTSGTSLQVCRDILINCGAKRVAMFALGKSI